MSSSLCERLTPEQETLIRVISEPFIASREWPVWQYVALPPRDQHGLDAASVLASLPDAGDMAPTSRSYGLIWRPDSYQQPNPGDRIAAPDLHPKPGPAPPPLRRELPRAH